VTTIDLDKAYMQSAINLAARGLGLTWPNPAVGCVIVRDDKVIARGWTQPGGRPHAESEALRRAGKKAGGSTVYVTLEPCAHQGTTPPCAKALIDANVRRVVIGIKDPDPRVNGAGIKMLQEAGILVDVGIEKNDAKLITGGFVKRQLEGRPLITLKLATSLDGRIACHSGDSKWVTGEIARKSGHLLRANHDGILVGAITAARDNPTLTCRLPGMLDSSPIRIIVDGGMRLPETNNLVVDAKKIPTWIFIIKKRTSENRKKAYANAGVEIIEIDSDEEGNPNLLKVVTFLGSRGLTRVLVEGGGVIAAALLKLGLVDEIFWYRASKIIGGDGLPAIGGLGIEKMRSAQCLEKISFDYVGDDIVERYRLVI
tara:strand:- start:1258 stop:2370 length:1113 start_codon:yes stop_codon:yes gene_type:complete